MAAQVILASILIAAAASAPVDPRYCVAEPARTASGSIMRSRTVLREFRKIHPCPSTGRTTGACPGWALDHVVPLSACGCDAVFNLQWLPVEIKSASGAHAKDRWERRVYSCPRMPSNAVPKSRRIGLAADPLIENALRWQSRNDPRANGAAIDSGRFGPLGDSGPNSVVLDEYVVAPVAVLNDACRPSAVAWFVVSVDINPVDGHSTPRIAHVGEEVLKYQPSVADRDAPGAVVLEPWVVRVVASGLNASPNSVDASRPIVGEVSVFRRLLVQLVPGQFGTPAGDAPSVSEVIYSGGYSRAAIAQARPDDLSSASAVGWRDRNESSITLAGDVESFHVIDDSRVEVTSGVVA